MPENVIKAPNQAKIQLRSKRSIILESTPNHSRRDRKKIKNSEKVYKAPATRGSNSISRTRGKSKQNIANPLEQISCSCVSSADNKEFTDQVLNSVYKESPSSSSDSINLLTESLLMDIVKTRLESPRRRPSNDTVSRALDSDDGDFDEPKGASVADESNLFQYALQDVSQEFAIYPELKSGLTDMQLLVIVGTISKILHKLNMEVKEIVPIPKLQVAGFPTTRRFSVDRKKAINILYRPWMKEFFEDAIKMINYDDRNDEEAKPIALVGPRGIGKSHCLYLLVAWLRKQSEKYRVFYLNELSLLKGDFRSVGDRVLLVKELTVSFPDGFAQPTINQYRAGEIRLFQALGDIANCYLKEGLKVVIVLDQCNSLSWCSQDVQSMVMNGINDLGKQIPVIVSYSANNNFKVPIDGYRLYDKADYLVEEDEQQSFCDFFSPGIDPDEVRSLISTVGKVPLEIVTCLKSRAANFNDKLSEYIKTREDNFEKNVYKFFREIPPSEERKTIESIVEIIARAGTSSKKHQIFDKKLVMERKEQDYFIYTFINRIALNVTWDALVHSYSSFLNDDEVLSSTIIGSDHPNSQRGLEIAYYMIRRIILQKKVVLKELGINLESVATLYFDPARLASLTITPQNILLVPHVANLAGFDFILYDFSMNRVLLIQVTVESDEKKHFKKSYEQLRSDGGSCLSLWLGQLYKLFKTQQPTYHEIYIIAVNHTKNANLALSGTKYGYHTIAIPELVEYFPALIRFKKK